MKVLITGSSGFVGRHVTSRLSEELVNFDILKREDNGLARFNQNGDCVKLCSHVDVVVHLAGLAHAKSKSVSRNDLFSANCAYTCDVARIMAKAGMKRFIFVSSASVYGKSSSKRPITESSLTEPKDYYGESKLAAEESLQYLAKELDFELIVLRPALIYGLDAPGNIGSLRRLIERVSVLPIGQKKNKRSYLSVKNLSDVLFRCLNYPLESNQTFNITDNTPISTTEMVEGLSVGLNKKVLLLSLHPSLWKWILRLIGKQKIYEQLFCDLVLDSEKIKKSLDWTPLETTSEGLRTLMELEEKPTKTYPKASK